MDDYETPRWLLEIAFPDGRYYDPCPLHGKQEGKDGLKETWPKDIPVFINPPWSCIGPWVEKATNHPGVVAMLLPVDVVASWWAYSKFFKVSLIDAKLKFIAWFDDHQTNLHGEHASTIIDQTGGGSNKVVVRPNVRGSEGRLFACSWWRKEASCPPL